MVSDKQKKRCVNTTAKFSNSAQASRYCQMLAAPQWIDSVLEWVPSTTLINTTGLKPIPPRPW